MLNNLNNNNDSAFMEITVHNKMLTNDENENVDKKKYYRS